jgi:hypothetical protein
MVTSKWFKDSCPYCKDQGFPSVIGDVEAGESVFGFTHTQVATTDIITLYTETSGKVNNMADTNYEVLVTRTAAGSESSSNDSVLYVSAQKRESFSLTGVANEVYDVIVRGRILY